MSSNNLLGCLTVIFILMETCSTKSIHRSRNRQIYNQNGINCPTGSNCLTLDTSAVFGMGTVPRCSSRECTTSDFELKDDLARDNVMSIVKAQYKDFNCQTAIDYMEKETTRTIYIARHRGQFNANYGIHYGNSVTRNRRSSDPVTNMGQLYDQQTSTSKTYANKCNKGDTYADTMQPTQKKELEQKCRLFKLYFDVDNERSIEVGDGSVLKWTHISKYLGKLAGTYKLLPAENNINYKVIYNQAACAITSNKMDLNTGPQKSIKEFFNAYADMVQSIHIHLYTLKNSVTEDSNSNCFEELLRFLTHLTELQQSLTNSEYKKDSDWIRYTAGVGQALIGALDKDGTVVDYYTGGGQSSRRANVCHKQILIEYSLYIHERSLRLKALDDKFVTIKGGSKKKGITYELDHIWKQMSKLLYKTYLMSLQVRFATKEMENTEVDKRIDKIYSLIYQDTFDVAQWWTAKLEKLSEKIEKKNQQA